MININSNYDQILNFIKSNLLHGDLSSVAAEKDYSKSMVEKVKSGGHRNMTILSALHAKALENCKVTNDMLRAIEAVLEPVNTN